MKKVYTKEELVRKNIYIQSSKEIPVNSMRGKALLDRLSYKGELTQEIYL
jgi:hypothetical protein